MASTKKHATILEALAHHATETPDRVLYTWVDANCTEKRRLTFKELEDESNAVAAKLLKLGCQKGDRVMVAYPFGLEFLAGMFGAMKIGVIPCSIYPPNPNQLKTEMPKFRGFAEDTRAKYALATCSFATSMTAASVIYKTGVTWIGTDKLPIKKSKPDKPKPYESFLGQPDDIAFIQYTSGSTGRPKGVMISHHNLVENCRAAGKMSKLNPASVAVLWVPQYHDLGLVGGFMTTLYNGDHLVMASPLDFLAKPLLWTDMIETYQATHTCAPNFAYSLLLKRLEQANRIADWSCVKFAMFGAEPTQPHIVEAVSETLSVRPENVYNLYGLAEAVVFLTGGSARVDAEGHVSCGEADSPTLKLRIVQDGNEVEDGQVGTIWAQSPRVAAGYYGQSQLTTSTFSNTLPGYDGTWLDTGDLGKIVDGQLYVTGRVKDVIIINGKNYYPTDVELSVDEEFGNIIRPGRTTAFQHGEDSVGVTVEGRKGFDKATNENLTVQIAGHVSQIHGLSVSEVLVLGHGVTPKTTSGKLKRSQTRQSTLAGEWKASDVLLQFRCEENILSAEDPEQTQTNTVQQCEQPSLDHSINSNVNLIMTSVLGEHMSPSKTWAENGLTSLKSAELRNRVEEELHVVLPTNFEQLYETSEALSLFLSTSVGNGFPILPPESHSGFQSKSSVHKFSKLQMGLFQALSLLLIILLLLMSVLPSFFVAVQIANGCEEPEPKCSSVRWLALPLLFPTFALSFSLVVVVCKWVIIGKYKPREIDLMSRDYLRWWYVDRLMHLWELLVGQFLLGTKHAWLFYRLLGANIAWSSKIDAFLRECDLITVGANSSVGHSLRCRKFRPWTHDSPRVIFRAIVIKSDCQVSGMVGPGAIIGAGSKVERLAAVEEGAQVPSRVIARGIPAHNAGSFEHDESKLWEETTLDAFKIVWTVVEAYHFFALYFLGHAILQTVLPAWRYTTLLHWFLLFPAASFLGLLSSAVLKWLLIGRREPSDDYERSLYRRATNWACDFHFWIAAWTFIPFFGQSKLGTVILKLHGLDVDMASGLNSAHYMFFPSNVDYVKVRASFLSVTNIDIDAPAQAKIEITDSSLGYRSNVHSGTKLVRSSVPARTQVSGCVYDLNPPAANSMTSNGTIFQSFLLPELAQLILLFVIFSSMVPAYEIGAVGAQQSITAFFGIMVAIILQLFIWILLGRLVEWLALNGPRGLFGIYINYVWSFRACNLLEMLLYGTPMFAYYAQMMGAKVDGELWYFGNALYEYGCLHFKARTIVDDAHLSGHYVDGNGLVIDDTIVSGVVHPGCYASAGCVLSGEEHGPWKVFHRSAALPEKSIHQYTEDSFEDDEPVEIEV